MKAELDEYIESLPSAERPARDLSARRRRLIPILRAHAAREHRRVRRRRNLALAAGSTFFLAAAAVAAAFGFWIGSPARHPVAATGSGATGRAGVPAALTVVDGAVLLEAAGVTRTLHTGESVDLATIGALEAPADRAVRMRLSDVVRLTLDPASRVRPIATGAAAGGAAPPALEVLALERGRAHLQVKKLGDTRRFHVLTPDADVEVRGTAFDVALRPGATPQTCVSVTEGLVQVASGLTSRLLEAGESWGCGDASAGTEVPTSAAATVKVKGAGTGTGTETKTRSRTRTGKAEEGDLGAQNRLFQAALGAERAGRYDEAVRSYRRLLARAPEGPLAAQARANLQALADAQR